MQEVSFFQFYGKMKEFRAKLIITKFVEHKISYKMVKSKLDFLLYEHNTLELNEFIQQKISKNRYEMAKSL